MIVESDKSAGERLALREVPPSRRPLPAEVPRHGLKLRPSPYLYCKRAVDFVLALVLLLLAAPLVVVAGVLVKLTSRGPVLYTQTRLGLRGRPFLIYKLRTMVHECEKMS